MVRDPKINRFTFVVNKKELELIRSLAENLNRTKSDAVRFVVTEAAKQLDKQRGDHERS